MHPEDPLRYMEKSNFLEMRNSGEQCMCTPGGNEMEFHLFLPIPKIYLNTRMLNGNNEGDGVINGTLNHERMHVNAWNGELQSIIAELKSSNQCCNGDDRASKMFLRITNQIWQFAADNGEHNATRNPLIPRAGRNEAPIALPVPVDIPNSLQVRPALRPQP